MSSKIEKINRQTVTDQVYDIIVKKISAGEWKKGEKIPSEIELAQDLGVSRNTLKKALQKLNTLGIIETRVGEGSFVQDFNFNVFLSELLKSNLIADNFNEINQFRVMIEYCVLHLTVLNPVDLEALDALETSLQKMAVAIKDDNDDIYHEEHFHFHNIICNMSGNKLFIQLYSSLKDILFDIYKANSVTTWAICGKEESIRHHQMLFTGIKNRDICQLRKLQEELLIDEYLNSK